MSRFNGGWVKIYRDLIREDIGERGNFTLGVFVRLLAIANWREGSTLAGGQRVKLQPGQLISGLRELSPDYEEDPYLNRIRSALGYLETRGSITQATSNHGRLITICNWDDYQVDETPANNEPTSKPQADHKQTTSGPQHIEEVRSKNNTNTRRSRSEYDPAFEEVYKNYPRQEGKSRGYKIWLKLPQEEKALIATSVANYARRKAGVEPQYLKLFSTFMGEWRDWLDPNTGTAQGQTSKVREKTLEEVLRGA